MRTVVKFMPASSGSSSVSQGQINLSRKVGLLRGRAEKVMGCRIKASRTRRQGVRECGKAVRVSQGPSGSVRVSLGQSGTIKGKKAAG